MAATAVDMVAAITGDIPVAGIMADTLAATMADPAVAVLATGSRGAIATGSIEAEKTLVAADIRHQTTQSISGMAMEHTARDLLGDTRLVTSSTAAITAGID